MKVQALFIYLYFSKFKIKLVFEGLNISTSYEFIPNSLFVEETTILLLYKIIIMA